jgi:hypothetical protein
VIRRVAIATLWLVFPAILWANTSRENREDKRVFIGASPVGLHLPTLLTHPAGVGLYLGPDFLVGAEYGSISAAFDDGTIDASATYTNLGAYARWFPPGTNSVNVGAALHRRVLDANARVQVEDPLYGSLRVDGSLSADATVGSLILGNQWMMDYGLVIAVDWLVMSRLLSGSSSGNISGTVQLPTGQQIDVDQLDPDTREQAERDLAELGDLVNQVSAFPGALVLTVGWAF